MNLSKYIGKTFPAGKTLKELNLDTSRKFVVAVKDGHHTFDVGDILEFAYDYSDYWASFIRVRDGKRGGIHHSHLAYLDEEDDVEKKEYVPRVGDRVSVEAVVKSIDVDDNSFMLDFPISVVHAWAWWPVKDADNLTLISRASRTLTKAEAEKMLSEKLGEEVSIE